MRFATKLTLLFSGLFLILCVLITHIATSSSDEILERTIENQMEARALGKMDKIDKVLNERVMDMKMMASESLFKSKNPSPKLAMERLEELAKSSDYYTSISFFDMSRRRIADTSGVDVGKIHSPNEYWPAIESGKESVVDMFMSESLHVPVFHVAMVVKDNAGSPTGVLVGRMSAGLLSEIMRFHATIQPFDKVLDEENLMKVDLVNKDGLIVYSNYNEGNILKKTSKYWPYIKDEVRRGTMYKGYRLELPGMEEEIVTFGHEQGYRDYKGNGWTLIIHVPSKVVFAPATGLRNSLILSMTAIGGFSLLVILLFARTISTPLMKLSAVATEIGKGNLDLKVKVDSEDEVAELAKSLNAMVENLSASHQALEKSRRDAEKARDDAENATLLKDKFVVLVSHDLKGPLSAMLGFLKLLRKDMDATKAGEKLLLGSAISSGENMVSLINDILNVSRIRSGKIAPKLVFTDVRFLSVKVIAVLAAQAEQKGITLVNRLPRKTYLYADPELIGQALQNLISNAIKFCHGGGTVTIFMPDGEPSTIAVSDTGVGISPESIGKLFKYEETTSTTGTAGEAGTGFGLPLSNEIVVSHGGSLTVESTLGKGSTFRISLPLVRPRILIVDDDIPIRDLIKKYLRGMDFEFIEAGDGEEALAIMEKTSPHLIMTDLIMPVMDGFTLLERVKKNPMAKHLPVIVVTSDSGIESRERALQLGAEDFINKDMGQNEFILRVSKLLRIPHSSN